MINQEKTAEVWARALYSWFMNDPTVWEKEDCQALAKAALSIRQLTEAESKTYRVCGMVCDFANRAPMKRTAMPRQGKQLK